ncbi:MULTISPECIES: 5-(carboxyamino)imidazole ribonucleotide synthase [unclassified Hyphomicrobium]|uniref:5-(carboxyamino)imidazole ribonucleotide synthase n=1 Tax=unclassified Hyphomicrobium TaxID=2619925 RepID=UPI000213DA76|nr:MULTISPECIES: 5-(carboxyamino)imidazole ribonucleotide synthase [unclassified Hyphomicrobium]CCB63816.1 phosphoribosylaminoimidazole carboxylase, ATPase subunit [Hyphomicrobium sp. MC1]
MTAFPPGSTIGILGGGQLGRMLALAAARLGLKSHIYAPEADSPAFDVAAAHTVAAYEDETQLAKFASAIDVATYEFENIPVHTVEFLSTRIPVRPGAKALACAQDRMNEKSLARELGAMTAEFAAIDSFADLAKTLDNGFTIPSVLKTRRFGYDGKGQAKILTRADAKSAWAAMRDQPSILESFVNFRAEVSVVAARAIDGSFKAFDVTENEHRNHILHRSLAPAALAPDVASEAVTIAQKIAERLDYVGVFAIEFFLVAQNGRDHLYVNEMAPRVHNSGHWTMDGALTSQFEQHIRAVAGWPLGSTSLKAPAAEMINLIGDDILAWEKIAAEPGAFFHHYGKKEARPGRKMGHVNRLLPKK